MANRAANQAKTRQRMCLYEDVQDAVRYICTRDLGHDGDHKLIRRDDMPERLRAALLVDADDTSTQPQTGFGHDEFGTDPDTGTYHPVPVDASLIRNGSSHSTDTTIAKVVHQLAALAEQDRFANVYSYEIKTAIALSGDLAAATAQLADRRLVDPAVIGRIRQRVEGWAIQRAPRGEADQANKEPVP